MKPFLLFLILFLINCTSYPQKFKLSQFEHYNSEDGLPNNSINSIYKDSRGFMWFCTEGGISRYDGYSFVNYRFNPNDNTSLGDNYVICVCEDKKGKLWIGTKNGLNRFDPSADKFERINLDKNTGSNIEYNWITALIPCKFGGIWIASRSGLYRIINNSTNINWITKKNYGKYIYRFKKIKMVHYVHTADDTNSLNDNGLYCLHQDKNGILWIGSDNGGSGLGALQKLSPGSNSDYPPKFKKYKYNVKAPNSSMGRYLMSISNDRYGNLWIGTWMDGLYRFNPITEKITRFIKRENDPGTINCNNVFFTTEDSSGNLWISTYGGGLNEIKAGQITSDKPDFIHVRENTKNEDDFIYQNLRSIYLDSQNQLWIGSLGDGFYKTRLKRTFHILQHIPGNPRSLSDNRIHYIFQDSEGKIWIVTKDGVINKLVRATNTFKHYYIGSNDGTKVYNFPYITEYNKNLLIAFENKIYKFNMKTGALTDFLKSIHFPDSLVKKSSAYQAILKEHNGSLIFSNSNFRVLASRKGLTYNFKELPLPDFLSFFRDSKSDLWFSTRFEGLYEFDSTYSLITRIAFKIPDYNSGYGFVETKNEFIWAATSRGLFQYDLRTKKYRYWGVKDGLISSDTRGILLDNHNNIWLSTNHGLSRFNTKTKEFKNIDRNDGLPIINFNSRVYCKSKDGEFYFGSDEGILHFYPDSVEFNRIVPNVYITGFKIFNKNVKTGENVDGKIILEKNISFTKKILLPYTSNVLLFQFSALNYLAPENNKYAYKMVGIDKDWNYVNADQRFAVYAGLQYGEYDFRVKASNNDGIWNNKGASILIIITPPWWETTWFRVLGIIFILFTAVVLFKLRTDKIRKRNLELEQHVINRTKQLEIANKELEAFAYTVSHDLRAPLRGIDGFSQILLEDYNEKLDGEGKKNLGRIRIAAQRMAQLIDDVLSLSKISRTEMKYKTVNLSSIANEISENLNKLQPDRNVEFKIQQGISVSGDPTLLEIVMVNLFDNAFKFTLPNVSAHIEFGRKQLEDKILYFIKDDGVGFDMKYSNKLFKAFERFHNSNEFPGNGIGLATVQRIIQRHGGTIWAESAVGKGTTFYFTITQVDRQNLRTVKN